MQHEAWLKDVLVFLVAAGLIVPLFHRARVGAVLGFLLIGVAVGPYGFGALAADYPWLRYLTIEDRARAEPFAELGVMFLLFMIGIEMSVERLWSLRRFVAGIGSVQFLLSAVAFGAALSLLGAPGSAAIILGLGLAMSSTAVVMQLLEEQGRTATPLGHVAIAVLLFQDLMVAPVLFGAEILARGGDVALGLARALLVAAAAIAVILVAGRFVMRPLFSVAGRTGSRELIMAMTLLMVIGVATATGYVGLSTALGAFLAGVLLSETEYRHQIEIDVAPFKGLLVGLFFITVGMSIDVRVVWNAIGTILLAVAVLLVVKAVILYGACRLFGVALGVTVEAAILLAQAGEFAFIVIALGRITGLVPGEFAPGRDRGGRHQHDAHAVPRDGRPRDRGTDCADRASRPHAAGPPGRAYRSRHHRRLRPGGTAYRPTAASGERSVRRARHQCRAGKRRLKRGETVFFGDAARGEFLHRAGAAGARAFVVTVNSPRAAERMVAAAHKERPDAPVFARARDPAHAARLLRLGAAEVTPETVEASLQLGARVLEGLGVSDDAIARRVDNMRRGELAHLSEGDGERRGRRPVRGH